MSDISPISRPSASNLGHSHNVVRPSAAAGAPPRGHDRVELSAAAQLLGKLQDVPAIRHQLVEDVRAAIANGTYESPDKLEGSLNGLIEDLNDLV